MAKEIGLGDMMYKNVDEVLRDIYRFGALRIEPLNNTAQIVNWCANKGVLQGGGELTQHEHHANAAMIISRVERVLNRFELAAVELQYTGGLKTNGIVDLTELIEEQNKGVNLLICDDLLMNLFCGKPKKIVIQDKYDLSKATVWRQQKQIRRSIALLLNSAICKLELEFKKVNIIKAEKIT